MARAPTDWDALRSEYVTGSMSYKALCEREHISLRTLGDMARRGEWGKKRKEYRDRLNAKREKMAEKKALRQFERLKSVTDRTLDKAEQLLDIYQDDPMATRDLKALADVLTSLTELTRDLHGVPNQPEQHRQMIAEERLQLAREQAQYEREKVQTSNIQIVLRGADDDDLAEDWGDIGG